MKFLATSVLLSCVLGSPIYERGNSLEENEIVKRFWMGTRRVMWIAPNGTVIDSCVPETIASPETTVEENLVPCPDGEPEPTAEQEAEAERLRQKAIAETKRLARIKAQRAETKRAQAEPSRKRPIAAPQKKKNPGRGN